MVFLIKYVIPYVVFLGRVVVLPRGVISSAYELVLTGNYQVLSLGICTVIWRKAPVYISPCVFKDRDRDGQGSADTREALLIPYVFCAPFQQSYKFYLSSA